MKMMKHLPSDVQMIIYEFDSTYRDKFQLVLQEFCRKFPSACYETLYTPITKGSFIPYSTTRYSHVSNLCFHLHGPWQEYRYDGLNNKWWLHTSKMYHHGILIGAERIYNRQEVIIKEIIHPLTQDLFSSFLFCIVEKNNG